MPRVIKFKNLKIFCSVFLTAALFTFNAKANAQTFPNASASQAIGGWESSIGQYALVNIESNHSMDVDCVAGCSTGGGGGGGASTAAFGTYVDGFNPDIGSLSDAAYNGSNIASLIALNKVEYSQLNTLITQTTGLATSANQTTGNSYLNSIVTNTGLGATAAKQPTLNADGGAPAHVTNSPVVLSSTNGSTTITTGGAFQTLLAQNTSRKGCLIQNPITATEPLFVYVYSGTTGTPTVAASYGLGAGASFNCAVGGFGVVSDQIAVESTTTGHAFVETNQ